MTTTVLDPSLADDVQRLMTARHHDPRAVLGRHNGVVRVFLPGARSVRLTDIGAPMSRLGDSFCFEFSGLCEQLPDRYRLAWWDADGGRHEEHDPYSFPPQITDRDLHLFAEGSHWYAHGFLGAHPRTVDGISGVLFSTWAPNAERVSVVGDFNGWDGRRHPMGVRGRSGVWEVFIPEVTPGTVYKFEIRARGSGRVFLKTDPYGRQFERRPATAAIVAADSAFAWGDAEWLQRRAETHWLHMPVSIYEVHLGSWRRTDEGGFMSYRELAEQLVPYVAELGFTHIELMPVTEHPLDASWGYQTTGFFAPTSRHGGPDDLRVLIDRCHAQGIGVILDWVPGHFPRDAHALADYDGTPLYEHEDPRRREHRDWGTLVFNYGRCEVRSFLISSALYWLEQFHIDGLRVDAVAAMLYLDYSRSAGEWVPNEYGGREDLQAIEFLREMNAQTQTRFPGALVIAEESTAWPQVTRPPWVGGLGFSMKWNMGWMHDTLRYLGRDPVYRRFHHDELTFGLLYAFHENFVLPLSHDEVVHGKASLLGKMPGDDWQRFANLRLLYSYMFTQPGKKLLFMGSELAQWREWQHDESLHWHVLEHDRHQGVRRLIVDLNRLYRTRPALHYHDFEAGGFEWIDCHDAGQSVLSYLRRSADEFVVVVLNFTPVPRINYRIGVPEAGSYRELLNSDSSRYGGSDVGNAGGVQSLSRPWMGRPHALELTLPPLGALVLQHNAGASG